MFVWINTNFLGSNLESEALRFALVSGLHSKVDLARNFIRIHDFESFLDTFWVFRSNKGAEPEDAL
jgi:hypothetical protein